MKCLAVRFAALHAAQPGQAKEDFVVPPVAVTLGREALVQQFGFAVRQAAVSGKYIGEPTQVTVPFGDLVSEEERVPETPWARSR